MLFRAVDSGVPPRSSTVPVSIQVQCKYGRVVWFVEELGRFDQAFSFEEVFKEPSTSIGFPGSGRERQLAHICSNSTKRYSTRECKGTFTHWQILFLAKKVFLPTLWEKRRGKKIWERKTLSTTTRLGTEWPPCEQMTWTAVGASETWAEIVLWNYLSFSFSLRYDISRRVWSRNLFFGAAFFSFKVQDQPGNRLKPRSWSLW